MWEIIKDPNLVFKGDRVRSKKMFFPGYMEGIVDYITVDVRGDHTRINVIDEHYETICYNLFGDSTRTIEVWKE